MTILRQATSFGLVGVCATLTHVGAAWSLIASGSDPYLANCVGAALAFLVSFYGNARFSFAVRSRLSLHALRYAGVSGASLILTTLELHIVRHLGLPTFVYAAVVLATVPPTTFFLARSWAFAVPARA